MNSEGGGETGSMYVTVRVVTGKPWLLCLSNDVRLLLLEQDL